MNYKIKALLLSVIVLTACIAIIPILSCTDNPVDSKSSGNQLAMKLSIASSPELMEMVNSFRVIISGEGFDSLIRPLNIENGIVKGTIDSVPAGDAITFKAQALDDTTVIYEGDTTVAIKPDVKNIVSIDLQPKVSLVKLSPRYLQVEPGQQEEFQVKVYGIHALNQISFRLYSDYGYLYPDSTKLAYISGTDMILFDTISYNPSFYALAFSNRTTNPLVNSSGNATLATIYFTGPRSEIIPDSTIITIDSLTLYDTAGDPIIVADMIYCDQTTLVIGSDTTSVDTIVNFPDPVLEQAIRETTGVMSGDIKLSDVLPIDSLSIDSGVTNLSGLQHCTNLIYLCLNCEYCDTTTSAGFSDLTPLQNLTNLQCLVLGSNSITDLSPLQNLTNLDTLALGSTSITDISPLRNLTNLQWLNLYNTSVSDISPLQNLTNLQCLSLYNTSVSDISPLQNLTNLQCLSLYNTSVSDISSLQNLTNLQVLYLWDNSISDISPLVNNSGIGDGDEVWLYGNPLDSTSINMHIPALRDRGVTVYY